MQQGAVICRRIPAQLLAWHFAHLSVLDQTGSLSNPGKGYGFSSYLACVYSRAGLCFHVYKAFKEQYAGKYQFVSCSICPGKRTEEPSHCHPACFKKCLNSSSYCVRHEFWPYAGRFGHYRECFWLARLGEILYILYF